MKAAYPNKQLAEDAQETLETRMNHLCEMMQEYKANKEAFATKNENLVKSIESLENIVKDEVMKLGKTVVVGNIKAEYKPTVTIKIRKEQNNDN
jgi:phage host-nuclease inhibitor protein Gam